MAEEFISATPYNYTLNNPISNIDPDGRFTLEGLAAQNFVRDLQSQMGASDNEHDPPSKGWNRFWGGAKALGGTAEMVVGAAGGIATSWTGIGAVAGGLAFVHGADVASAGLNQLITGEETSSFTSQGLQSLGVSQQNAELVDAGISIGLTAGAGVYTTSTGKVSTIANTTSYSKIGSTGKVGEDALKTLGGESQVFFRTDKGGRYIDQFVNGAAHESKVGYTTLNRSTKAQIYKDAALMKSKDIKSSTWHFFQSPITRKLGPSKPLFNELQKNGIKVKMH